MLLSTTCILIKIAQCHCLDPTFLKNWYTDFDETLHVAWVCLPEGFSAIGTSGYSPVQKKGGRRPPPPCEWAKVQNLYFLESEIFFKIEKITLTEVFFVKSTTYLDILASKRPLFF